VVVDRFLVVGDGNGFGRACGMGLTGVPGRPVV
jgi:hypothetical protein